MKKRRTFVTIFLALCLAMTTIISFPILDTASAKEIASESQAKKLAKKQVKGAKVIEVEADHDDGILEYEVKLIKGKKEYDLKYRAADSKLISYTWEIESGYIGRGKGRIISKKKCKKIAKKKVPKGSILSVVRKRSDGIDLYKVKMRMSGKSYEMEIHARTGKVLEYEWELISKSYTRNMKLMR